MADEITPEQIADAAVKPSSVTVDGVTVTARPIADVLEAAKHLAGKKATKNRSAWACLKPASHTSDGGE